MERKYTKMINVTTGEVVEVVESSYIDKLGYWSTIKLVRDKWGETPLWQYRYELRPAV